MGRQINLLEMIKECEEDGKEEINRGTEEEAGTKETSL